MSIFGPGLYEKHYSEVDLFNSFKLIKIWYNFFKKIILVNELIYSIYNLNLISIQSQIKLN